MDKLAILDFELDILAFINNTITFSYPDALKKIVQADSPEPVVPVAVLTSHSAFKYSYTLSYTNSKTYEVVTIFSSVIVNDFHICLASLKQHFIYMMKEEGL